MAASAQATNEIERTDGAAESMATNEHTTQYGANYQRYLHEVAENENNENLACASYMQAASHSNLQLNCQNAGLFHDDASTMCNSNTHLRNDQSCKLDENKKEKQCLPDSLTHLSDQTKYETPNVSNQCFNNARSLNDNQVSSDNAAVYSDASEKQARESEKSAQNCSMKLPVHVNRTPFKQQDMLVPWQLKGNNSNTKSTFHRFYHVFKEGELEGLCAVVNGCRVVKSYYDQGNWCVVLEKTM